MMGRNIRHLNDSQSAVSRKGMLGTLTSKTAFGGPLTIRREHQSISNQVHLRLRAAILDAKVLPGAALSESELAVQLGVSRTPIREAIQKLEAEDLVHVLPQRGTFVALMDLALIQQSLFMREAVECAAMARLPAPLPLVVVEGLDAIIRLHREAACVNDSSSVVAADDAFHRTLLELAGVPTAWRYVLETREAHRRVRVLAQSEFQTALPAAEQHAEIVTQLRAGNQAQASEALRQHIRGNLRFADDMARCHPEYFTS